MVKLGDVGEVSYNGSAVIVKGAYELQGVGAVKLELSIQAVDLLRLLAKQTTNSLDDTVVELVAAALSKGI